MLQALCILVGVRRCMPLSLCRLVRPLFYQFFGKDLYCICSGKRALVDLLGDISSLGESVYALSCYNIYGCNLLVFARVQGAGAVAVYLCCNMICEEKVVGVV